MTITSVALPHPSMIAWWNSWKMTAAPARSCSSTARPRRLSSRSCGTTVAVPIGPQRAVGGARRLDHVEGGGEVVERDVAGLQHEAEGAGGVVGCRGVHLRAADVPRRTEIRPSLSRMRNASRNEGRDTWNSLMSWSCFGSMLPSGSVPATIWARIASATSSATLGCANWPRWGRHDDGFRRDCHRTCLQERDDPAPG